MISLKKVKQKICPTARKEMIVDAALEIMAAQGVAALTMDKVIAKLPCSKGTVYNNFSCKEDLLMGIGDKAVKILISFFKRAIKFEGSTREKVLSIHLSYLIYAILYNDLFQSVIAIKSPTVYNKASAEKIQEHEQLELKLMTIFNVLITTAIENGDLKNNNNLTNQQISFSLWAMNFGTIALLGEDLAICDGRRGLEVEREYFNHNNILLDGLGWTPLNADFDYRQSARKILSQLFSQEMTLIAQSGRVLMF
ncbi:MAG: TetR/AcrR family transcriptional regulator [Alteromonadaceae bacterium]|nr:TetR/AcrR family transcriptional regulator [Alteromonadaceae bacterium]